MIPSADQGLLAFRRLMADAGANGHAKVDAIVALSQRTVHVATWAPAHDGYRTVINKSGESALPVFTSPRELMRAALRFHWSPGGATVGSTEIGARDALRYVQSHSLALAVVDIASPHAMEVAWAEVEPLLERSDRHSPSGPFAAVGRIGSTMLEVVESRSSTRPPAPSVGQGTPAPAVGRESVATPRESGVMDVGAFGRRASATTPPSITTPLLPAQPKPEVTIESLALDGLEALLGELAELLREYPEVEWAAAFAASRAEAPFAPTAGLRVDAAYRIRLPEIISTIRERSAARGMAFDVLLLDDPELIRQVRNEATLFFPWVRRARA